MDARPRLTWALVRTYLNQRLWKLWSLLRRCWPWIWRLAVVVFLIDLIIPVIGNKYLPPRAGNQPKAPYGLSLVDPQPDAIFPPAVDIFFVHGLGAFPDTTWQKRPQQNAGGIVSEQKISWIRDLLQQDLPEARLLFFNYDSTVHNDAPQKDLQDIGIELLQAFNISRLRQSSLERKRPMIFLCHSYGGLVVKEVGQETLRSIKPVDVWKALLQAASAPIEHQDILTNIRGIIFLGTPHRGTKYSDYARAAALRLNRLNANPDIFLPLKVNSSALLTQHATFMDRYGHLDVVNFYETRAIPIFDYPITRLWYKDILVERFSATFDNATNALIDTHHSGLNKFGSRKDPGYRKVRFALEYMINRIVKQRIESQNHPSSQLNGHNSTVSGADYHCSQEARHVIPFSTVNSYTERLNVMDQIISDLSFFQEFRDPPRSVALWGIGGSGKSQLAMRFIEKHNHDYNTVLWIDAQSPVAAIRSYAAAFERLKLDYPQHVFDEVRHNGDLYDRRGFSIEDNWVIRTVKEWLEDASCKWLVVIDNADNLAWVPDIMPRGRMGSVIITSRDRMVYRFVNHAIHVDMMNTEEALSLLLRSANIPSSTSQNHGSEIIQQKSRKHQALLIVHELGYLALAIDLAGAYISQHDFVQEDLARYLDFLQENSVALLSNEALRDAENYHHTIATVWETSFAAIKKTSPKLAQLLIFMAHLSTTHIEDRLFDESSIWMYEQSKAHPTWKALARFLQAIFYFLLPIGCAYLLKATIPWKPHFQGQALSMVKMLLISMPLVFDVIAMIVLGLLRGHELYEGNVVTKDRALIRPDIIIILLELGIGNTLDVFAKWFLPDEERLSTFRILALSYTSGVGLLWVYETHLSNVGEKMAMHARELLDQLDFSHSSIARFFAVIRTFHRASEFTKEWKFLGTIAWILLWFIVLKILVTFAICLVYLLWCQIVNFLDARVPYRRLRLFLNATTSMLGFEVFFGILFILSIYGLYKTRIPAWIPWVSRDPPPLSIPPVLINSLLKTNNEGQWNPRTYSDVMGPLTRFSLMQRETDSAYSMHVLVRWWARHRLPFVMQQAWARETERFISMSYSSSNCWLDPLCQQMLIPHLVDVANLGATTGAYGWNSLQDLLKKLYRSLRLVGESYGVSSDE